MINIFSYGGRKDILRNGYQPPKNLSGQDRLCKSCLMELRKNQKQGKTYDEAVSMTRQMFWCFLFPGFAALNIEKWMKMWIFSIFPQYGMIIVLGFFEIEFYEVPWIALLLYFTFPLNFYWIHRWTKEWNKNKI